MEFLTSHTTNRALLAELKATVILNHPSWTAMFKSQRKLGFPALCFADFPAGRSSETPTGATTTPAVCELENPRNGNQAYPRHEHSEPTDAFDQRRPNDVRPSYAHRQRSGGGLRWRGMSSADTSATGGSNTWFVTTRWSVVLSAKEADPERSSQALETLCRAYWYPLYAFARRSGHAPADAEDLTQGFFARLLQKDYLKSVAREKGRFRSFLLASLKRFMANEWDRQHAQKRGGFAEIVSIDTAAAELRFASDAALNAPPDALFDRQWATTLLEQTLLALQEEYAASGRATLFEHLRPCLARDESALSYAEIATRLNLTEAAVKMAVQRLRARYREILRREIAETVSTEAEIEEELRHLFSAFGG